MLIKLLNASFTRLYKNRLFWLFTIFSMGLALLVIYVQYNNMKRYGDIINIEQIALNYSTMIGIAIAIFTSLFLGVEYSDGVIRNKISIGHKRENIYLSNLIIVIITSLFSYFLYLMVVFSVGIPVFGMDTISFMELLGKIILVLVVIMAYSSIFTFIAMVISSKTITAITSIMLAFGMIMAALTCFNILAAPKTIQEATMVNGETKIQTVLNPKYPSEEKKKRCQILLDINPAGAMFQLAGRSAETSKVLPLYSFGIIVLFTGAGLLLFKRKELK